MSGLQPRERWRRLDEERGVRGADGGLGAIGGEEAGGQRMEGSGLADKKAQRF